MRLRRRLLPDALRKRRQPASTGAARCDCGRPSVKKSSNGWVCQRCLDCEAAMRETERKSAETCDNLAVFNPTPSPYCEAWRWTVAR